MNSKNHGPGFIHIYSNELLNQNGSLSIQVSVHAEDTMYFYTDSVTFIDSSIFSYAISGISGTHTLFPGDSLLFSITGSYNPSALPYSYTNNKVAFKVLNVDSVECFEIGTFKVYFTPYGTTEIWNSFDFDDLPRTWEVFDSIQPQRVYIDPLTIPVSDRNTPTDSSEEWEYEFQLKRLEGLPYAVQMAAAHPDSLAIYVHRDSTNGHDTSLMQKGVFYDSYTGVVSGRLSIRMLNDNNEWFTLHPAGVKVRLKEDDMLGTPTGTNGLNIKIGEAYTDEEGNFQINYTTSQPGFEQGDLELYLEIVTEDNGDYGFQVRKTIWGPYQIYRNLGSVGNNAQVNLGDWFIEGGSSYWFRVFHYARNVFKFCEDQLGYNALSGNLDIKLDRESYYLPLPSKTVRLGDGDDEHESVVYHEMGHFVMGELQGYYPNDQCLFLNHGYAREINHIAAWTEGWANGFAAMVDLAFSEEDGEFGMDAFVQGGIDPTSGNRVWWSMEDRERGTLNRTDPDFPSGNGFRSEYHIATALYDLFDGPTNFPNNNVTDNDWNDVGGRDGYTIGSDNVCLTFADIVAPMMASGSSINSIQNYYSGLISHLRNSSGNCSEIGNVNNVFQENRVSFDISNANYIETSLSGNIATLDNPFFDPINDFYNTEILNENCAWGMDETFRLKISNISGLNESFNFISPSGTTTVWLHDPLSIQDGAILWCNEHQENPGWYTRPNGTILFPNSLLNLNLCNGQTEILSDGIIEVGSADGSTFSNFIINKNSTLIIRSGGKLIVNNGSSVIVENHGLLVFEDGAEIELAGSNAILEIKGRLELGEDAEFLTTGSGLVRFNMPEYPGTEQYNIFTTGNNCKVTFSGKNVEVVEGTYVYPMDNLAMFTLLNSTIKLGTDAFFNLGCQVTLESSIFRKIPTYPDLYVHAGIKLYGQNVDAEGRVVIKNCTFLDAKYGVRAFQTPGGNSTKITGSTFTNCDFPLMVYDRGAYLFANVFYQCGHGIQAEFTTNYFNIESNIVKNISGIGLTSFAQPGSKFIIAGNIFKESYSAMYFNRTVAYLKCNAIYSNNMISMSENLGFYRANRFLFTRFWFEQAGDNLFEEIVTQNYSGNWAYFNGNSRYSFGQGYNHFKRVNNNNTVFTISATLDRSNNTAHPLDLLFDNNYWTLQMALLNPSVPNFLSLNPSSTYNPHFRISVNNASTQPIFVYGQELSSFPGCPITEWAGAITYKDSYIPGQIPGILFKNLPDDGLLSQNLLYDQSRTVSGGIYNGQVLETALRSALNATYLGMNYDKDSVKINDLLNLGDLLIHTIGSLNYQHDDDYMYDEYMSALNSAISAGQITTLNQSAYVSQAAEIIEAKLDAIAEMQYTFPEAYYSYRFTYNLDKAYLYRIFRMYTEALNQIAYLESFANEKDLNLLDGVGCFINQEKQWRDSTITLFQFGEEVTLCSKVLDSTFTMVLEPLDSLSGEESSNDNVSYTLSPNPTSSTLTMDLDLEEDAYIEVRIYTKNGVLKLSDVLGNKTAGSHFKNYDVSSYFPDVYIFIVFADGVPYSENFVVSP